MKDIKIGTPKAKLIGVMAYGLNFKTLENVIGAIARVSIEHMNIDKFFDIDEKKARKSLKAIINRKHESPYEFLFFVFAILCSRACSHQLVRHRIASYLQNSQRFAGADNLFILPENMKRSEIIQHLKKEYNLYLSLIEQGIPQEDARYILPNAKATFLIAGMNLRSLKNFFNLRLCAKAQAEIREIAFQMYEQITQYAPELTAHIGPRCFEYYRCPEKHRNQIECGSIFSRLIHINPKVKIVLREIDFRKK